MSGTQLPVPPAPHASGLLKRFPALARFARIRLGIGTTLTIAFLAVAFLAAAANLISERGLDVVEAPLPSIGTRALTLPAIELRSIARAQSEATVELPPLEPVLPTLEQYDRTVSNRIRSESPTVDADYRKASKVLKNSGDAVLARIRDQVDEKDRARFRKAIEAYLAIGEERVRIATEQHRLVDAYLGRFDAMRSRAQASIDQSWKIFGRVVARQSVITLARQITDLGTLSTTVMSEHGVEAKRAPELVADAASLAVGEDAVANTLTQNEKGLTNSQGKEWVGSMREDLAALSSTRYEVFERRLRLRALEQQAIDMQVRLAVPHVGAQERTVSPPTIVTAEDVASPVIAPAVAAAFPIENERSSIIAWISAGVLLLLVIISATTVRSVVGPVRRMIRATARLAEGEMDARVPPGGIKELDTLAQAFNQMAERLAQAERAKRDYQMKLEAKVEERTAQLKHLASNDALTSLPNQRQLFVMLNETLDRASLENTMVGVYFLDVDNFKNINDGMGHSFGDKVLQAMAQRLRDVAGEFGFAARLGGDEFTVVLERATDLNHIREVGAQLVREFHAPLSIYNRDLALSISVGASAFPDHGRAAEGLLRAADAALFRAKALGRSQVSMYSPELLQAATAKFAVEQGLRRALERGDFELVYQPEFNLETLEVELVEALIRWRQPDGSLVSPGQFLAVAEESGLIMDISDWVLRRAIETVAHWHHGSWPRARVAINVSSRQLINAHFVQRIVSLLAQFRVPARCIEIELTETVLQTGTVTLEALRQLRAHGISIALDDFGTGYSSIASLQTLPLTRIKLDRSLVDEIDSSPRSLAIARSIIGLARNLGLQITAEGIERREQLDLLLREGNMCLQGYLFAQPLMDGDLIASLEGVANRARDLLPALPRTAKWERWEAEAADAAMRRPLIERAQASNLRVLGRNAPGTH
jgi:diguanylate cyclase (GGDEF)-like protein